MVNLDPNCAAAGSAAAWTLRAGLVMVEVCVVGSVAGVVEVVMAVVAGALVAIPVAVPVAV